MPPPPTRSPGAPGWSPEKVARFVLGHGEMVAGNRTPRVDGPRLAFIPLPSIERRGDGPPQVVTSIRRAMIAVLGGASAGDDLQRLSRLLSGSDLVGEENSQRVATLSLIPKSDSVVSLYTRPSSTWATVTPVILPGYDDPRKWRRGLFPGPDSGGQTLDQEEQKELMTRLERRIEFLLRKAIVQAGYSREMAQLAAIESRHWSASGRAPNRRRAIRFRTSPGVIGGCTCGSPGATRRGAAFRHAGADLSGGRPVPMDWGCSQRWKGVQADDSAAANPALVRTAPPARPGRDAGPAGGPAWSPGRPLWARCLGGESSGSRARAGRPASLAPAGRCGRMGRWPAAGQGAVGRAVNPGHRRGWAAAGVGRPERVEESHVRRSRRSRSGVAGRAATSVRSSGG